MDTKNNYCVYLGLFFFCGYVLQYFFHLDWTWLVEQQQKEYYKRWSGLVLGMFILFQWLLTISRVIKKLRKHSMKITALHKWIGAISPVLFYFHSASFGYGYLTLLSYIFFSNMLLGNLNLDFIKSQKDWIFKSWMIAHVSLSIVVTFLMIFHIGVVFYYK